MKPGPVAILIGLLAVAGQESRAGGLGRVNTTSPTAVGMAGAFAAVADDPSALHFNPAGLTTIDGPVLAVGLEYTNLKARYTPVDEEGNEGDVQRPNSSNGVLPSVGFAFRPTSEGVPSRLGFGIGLWNTYGGAISYKRMEDELSPALNSSTELVMELVTGAAYEVSEYLSVGLGVRLGLGLFSVDATSRPITADMSASGFGVGLTAGAMVSTGGPPEDAGSVRLGVTYRTPMTVTTSGEATVDLGGVPTDLEIEHDQKWPQSAAVGLAWRPVTRVLLAAQADWTDWNRIDTLEVEFPDRPALNQTFEQDWDSSYTFRLGTGVTVARAVTLLAGGAYDTRAVPLRTIERHNIDSDKLALDAGLVIAVAPRLKILGAIDYTFGRAVKVPNNTAEATDAGWPDRANKGPGIHDSRLVTVELGVHYLF